MLSIPLIRFDDPIIDGVIKRENIDNQVFNGIIKEEMIEEIDHNNDSRSFQIGYEINLHHSIILSLLIQF